VPGERIVAEALAHDSGERVEALAHVGRLDAEVDADRGGEEQHGPPSACELARQRLDHTPKRLRIEVARDRDPMPAADAELEAGVGASSRGSFINARGWRRHDLDEPATARAPRGAERSLPLV